MRESAQERPGIVLSGATGFVGGEVLARLIMRDDRPIYVLIRAGDEPEAKARLDDTLAELLGASRPWTDRVFAVAADLTRDSLGLDKRRFRWLAARAEWIIHCAASVSFTLGLRESRKINVQGTRRMLDLAATADDLGTLRCFTHVSTAYVAGAHEGTFHERDLDVGQVHRNPYERSKLEAEVEIRTRGRNLPMQVLRPSIVVGDSRTGWTPAFNVLYWPLRAFARGSYPFLPADPDSPVDVVPVDYVADALLELGERPGTTFHLTAADRAVSLGDLVALACEHLERPAPRLLSPSLYRRAVHPILVRFGPQARRRALRRSEPFFPYFAMNTRYDDSHARDVLAPSGIQAPPLASYFSRLMDYAERADWGRKPVPRHRLLAPGLRPRFRQRRPGERPRARGQRQAAAPGPVSHG